MGASAVRSAGDAMRIYFQLALLTFVSSVGGDSAERLYLYDDDYGQNCFDDANNLEHRCVWQCRVRSTWAINCQKCACLACQPCKLMTVAPPASDHAGCCRNDGAGEEALYNCPTYKKISFPMWAPGYTTRDANGKEMTDRDPWHQTHWGGQLEIPEWRAGMTIVVTFGTCVLRACEVQPGLGAPAQLVRAPSEAACAFMLRESPMSMLRAAGKRAGHYFEFAVTSVCKAGAVVTPYVECPYESVHAQHVASPPPAMITTSHPPPPPVAIFRAPVTGDVAIRPPPPVHREAQSSFAARDSLLAATTAPGASMSSTSAKQPPQYARQSRGRCHHLIRS